MKVFLILLSLISFNNSAFADMGEKTHDFMPDEFLMKSYIKAHETVVSQRVETFNRSGKTWVSKNLKGESSKKIKDLFKKAGVRKFNKITKNNHYYNLKIESINISFSTADLILDRVFISGKTFNINQHESLAQFQTRLRAFLKKNREKKKTSFIEKLIPNAYAQYYNRERLEDMVVLNASGVISITYYKAKWPFTKSEFAIDLAHALTSELNGAFDECSRKSQQLSDISFRRMGDSMKSIIDSMKTEGKIDRSKLISSLMKKFAVKNSSAEENAKESNLAPISGKCGKFDKKNPGIIQQMFPTLTKNPTDATMSYDAWLTKSSLLGSQVDAKRGVCDAIERTVSCLEGLEGIESKNIANQTTGGVQKINFSRISVFEEVSGTKGSSK